MKKVITLVVTFALTFAPALVNAIYAASGVRHRSLPIKPVA